ncbi:MAG: YgaP family membrane protein [Candidatus Deferrimicrobiaceae bacterium]
MNTERWIRVIAASFVLASLFLGLYVSRYWFLFTAFVGINLFQSGLMNWCLMETILKKAGVPEKKGGSIDAALRVPLRVVPEGVRGVQAPLG